MASTLKLTCILGFLVLACVAKLHGVKAAGECGKSSPDMEAFKLAPCASAAGDANAAVSSSCCDVVRKLAKNPGCLCAIALSNTAKMSGVRPENAITIPKRCNMADRPVGYKCGPYTLP